MANAGTPNRILLFDGVCNLCEHSVNFVLDRNEASDIYFAPLQSEKGRALLREYKVPFDMETVVFIEDSHAYTKSSAALRVSRHLTWPWPLLYYLFILIPVCLRDLGYNCVAKSRYSVWGKKDYCRMPTAALRARFLDVGAAASPSAAADSSPAATDTSRPDPESGDKLE
eukprot:TRINITY_DN1245_c0_g1_i1.p1 TRINITY_DN1245_c0_g1~~TRINITY_DN1245_c0_g1_i1.p1  ORF type:complete len:170 (-),score=20.03 TRINITY_DN1245_c0_g1_i1:98-607(-)